MFILLTAKFQNFQKRKLILTRLNSPSTHLEPVYEGTLTDCCKDQAVFDEGEVVKYWNKLPAHLVLAPCVSIFKTFFTVIGSKTSLQHLCNFCTHSLTTFSILLPRPFMW